MGQHDRRGQVGTRPVRRHRDHPQRPELACAAMQHAAGCRDVPGSRPSDPRRLDVVVRLEERQGRRHPGHLRSVASAALAAQRLRDQLERLLLAVQPAPSARGFRAHHRRRAHAAIAAHPHRPDHDRAQREDRLHPAGHAEPGLQRRAVRRDADPRSARHDVQPEPGPADDFGATGFNRRRVFGAREVGSAREHRLAWLDPLPPLLGPPRGWDAEHSDRRSRRGAVLADAVRPEQPGEHAVRPEHLRPERGDRTRRRDPGPAERQHAARRRTEQAPTAGRSIRSSAASATRTATSTRSGRPGSTVWDSLSRPAARRSCRSSPGVLGPARTRGRS